MTTMFAIKMANSLAMTMLISLTTIDNDQMDIDSDTVINDHWQLIIFVYGWQ